MAGSLRPGVSVSPFMDCSSVPLWPSDPARDDLDDSFAAVHTFLFTLSYLKEHKQEEQVHQQACMMIYADLQPHIPTGGWLGATVQFRRLSYTFPMV